MRLRSCLFYTGCFVLMLMSCAAPKKATTTTQVSRYSEDLSVWRPKPETTAATVAPTIAEDGRKQTVFVEPKYAVNKKLDPILDSINKTNVQRNFVDGFTIQVYSGSKKEDALNAKKELSSYLPELQSEVQYAQPNFRVKVGKYFNRMDAQKDYVDVRRHFPTAIVIPDKVSIK